MKVLCVGDIHVKVSNVPEIDEMTNKLIEIARERQPNFIVLLGDILDRHATIHVSCLMRAEKIVLELSKIAPTFVLVGNHDRPNNSNFLTDEHPFNAMKFWENTYIVDRVRSFVFSSSDIRESNEIDKDKDIEKEEEYRFVFAPYVPPGRFSEALETIQQPLEKTSAIFAHQEIRNAKMGAIISKEGDLWPEENPLLISGHIHDYDYLQNNMIYVGVPLMHSFGDRPDKTVSLFSFLKDKNHWSHYSQERIDLGLIKKTTVYLTTEELVKYVPEKDKLIKLVVKGDEASIQTAMKLDKVSRLKEEGIKISFKTIQKVDKNIEIVSKMTFKDRLLSEISKNELKWFNEIFF